MRCCVCAHTTHSTLHSEVRVYRMYTQFACEIFIFLSKHIQTIECCFFSDDISCYLVKAFAMLLTFNVHNVSFFFSCAKCVWCYVWCVDKVSFVVRLSIFFSSFSFSVRSTGMPNIAEFHRVFCTTLAIRKCVGRNEKR